MLKQILADMYIEPELLAELSEGQKQILFFKMREEQIRKWKEREVKLEKEEVVLKKPVKAPGKKVSWLKGLDEDVWVWVMGEHPEDKPYNQICDNIIAERARQQAQREAEQIRAKKEEELVKRFSNVQLMDSQMDIMEVLMKEAEEKELQARQAAAAEEQRRMELELQRREAEERRRAEEELRRLEEHRAQQIYMDLKEVQCSVQRHDKEDPEWQETLRRSKAADERRRSVAKQARDDYKRLSLKAVERGRVAAMSKAFGGAAPEPKPRFQPKPKPRTVLLNNQPLSRKAGVRRTQSTSSRETIIKWFKDKQVPMRAGFEKDQDCIAPWFHGIISRQEAEELLSSGVAGSFLVRVSERIMGYVLSYRCQEGYKHFLIDSSENSYIFLGVEQLQYASLADLVEYHKVEPITMAGGEQLLNPCGQRDGQLDYADLFS
ncbi:SH2 domain-containing protein 4A [Amia ocellicauda]|uniref:SH2 domain-containing protein 4A n=1 Tax=Amia ocellicauda TaxID=2972642 RepID=UPI003464E60F